MSDEQKQIRHTAEYLATIPDKQDIPFDALAIKASVVAKAYVAEHSPDDHETVTPEWINALPRPTPEGWPLGENPYHYFDFGFSQYGKRCWLWICVDSESPVVQTIVVLDRGHARRLIAELTRK